MTWENFMLKNHLCFTQSLLLITPLVYLCYVNNQSRESPFLCISVTLRNLREFRKILHSKTKLIRIPGGILMVFSNTLNTFVKMLLSPVTFSWFSKLLLKIFKSCDFFMIKTSNYHFNLIWKSKSKTKFDCWGQLQLENLLEESVN